MLQLSETDRAVLVTLEQDARMTFREVAATLNLAPITVKRSLRRLIDRGVLRHQAPYINAARLGVSVGTVYLTLSPLGFRKMDVFLQSLVNNSSIEWCCTLAGRFHVAINYFYRTTLESTRFLEYLTSQVGGVIIDRAFGRRRRYAIFGRRYLSAVPKRTNIILVDTDVELMKLDQVDRSIFAGIQGVSYSSQRLLGRNLKLPAATIHRRIQRLEEDKIILGYIYDLNSSIIEFRANILLRAARSADGLYEKILEYAAVVRNIIFVSLHEGSWDISVIVESESAPELETEIKRLLGTIATEVASTEVHSVFRDLKYQTYPGA